MKKRIVVHDLEKNFGAKKVLRGLSFVLEPGERLALVGQNGSGKTTLIRCLLGLYRYGGSIDVLGFDPRRQREEVLREIGFVPQSAPALRLTVDGFLTMNEALCGVEREEIADGARHLGLDVIDCLYRPFQNLSGGMKQKLLIAAALARRPKVLILDEPAASLDPSARAGFFARLEAMSSDTTMILSSHRVDEISSLVSRLIEMDAGTIALDDMIASGRESERGLLHVDIGFHEVPGLIARNLRAWGLAEAAPLRWKGEIASADRFRFLSMLARWSGWIRSLRLERENLI